MGLDGGTYITRSDVLRGASWALTAADTSRSTRGGNVRFRHRGGDAKADKCAKLPLPSIAPIEPRTISYASHGNLRWHAPLSGDGCQL